MGVMGIKTLINAYANIQLVVTHRDNLKENIWFNSVSELCRESKIKFIYSDDHSIDEIYEIIAKLNIDVIFSFYYRNILPDKILEIAKYGAVNMHGSYLPKYRGRVPVNWQIINGEIEGGATLHYMVKKPDAGDIIDQEKVPITFQDTPMTLFNKLEKAGEKILRNSLGKILNGTCQRIKQDNSKATYYGGRRPSDGQIDWRWDAKRIYNLVRGVTYPYPGAFSYLKNNKIIIWKCSINLEGEIGIKSEIGSIINNNKKLLVVVGDGLISIDKLEYNGSIYDNYVGLKKILNEQNFSEQLSSSH